MIFVSLMDNSLIRKEIIINPHGGIKEKEGERGERWGRKGWNFLGVRNM